MRMVCWVSDCKVAALARIGWLIVAEACGGGAHVSAGMVGMPMGGRPWQRLPACKQCCWQDNRWGGLMGGGGRLKPDAGCGAGTELADMVVAGTPSIPGGQQFGLGSSRWWCVSGAWLMLPLLITTQAAELHVASSAGCWYIASF
jgi:hypothetical protein